MTLRKMVELLANNPFAVYTVAHLAGRLPYNMGSRALDFQWDYWDIS